MNIITENLDNIALAVGGVFAYFGGKNIKRSDEKKASADALKSMQEGYNEFVIDQKERYQEIKAELIYCREELKLVRNQSNSLKEEVKTWKDKYNDLKKQFDEYKKQYETN
jgi:predicted nuclease with TOPRIM domain